MADRQVFPTGDGRTVVKLTANNRGLRSVRSRLKGLPLDSLVTLRWTCKGRSGPIQMERTLTVRQLIEKSRTAGRNPNNRWRGAVTDIQCTLESDD